MINGFHFDWLDAGDVYRTKTVGVAARCNDCQRGAARCLHIWDPAAMAAVAAAAKQRCWSLGAHSFCHRSIARKLLLLLLSGQNCGCLFLAA